LRVAPEAAAELKAARDWYEERQPGLGAEFVAAIRAVMGRVREAPAQFPILPRSPDVRRAVVERFPYVVVFLVREDSVHVLAVAHQHQHPTFWRGRAGGSGAKRRR
jgi:plasmid stabilization system protein ParE